MDMPNNVDMAKLMNMISKMDKAELEKRVSKLNELLSTEDKDRIMKEFKNK